MTTVTFTSSGTWTAPAGVYLIICQCQGPGANGTTGVGGSYSGGGGGGGEFAQESSLAVTPGHAYTFTIGTGGSGTATSFPGDSVTVTAHAGSAGTTSTGGAGGTGSTNSIHFNGGAGGNGVTGGGSASAGGAGVSPGGGGAGGANSGTGGTGGGSGAAGQIVIIYYASTATLSGAGTLLTPGEPPRVVNQWGNSYGQGTTFTSITSALQSCVVPLNPAYSLTTGSGVPAAGNWLFCIASWTQAPAIAEVHVGIADDARSWWREYPASQVSGNTRTTIGYAPNIAAAAGNVYVAPDGQVAAINVLVVEVAGLGPWDTVAGTTSNYAAAATSLVMSLGAPAQASFWIAGAGGDNTAATQAFAPGGWTTLSTLSQSDGPDQLASNYLTSAFLASSSSSQSVSATAVTAEDLSGFMLAVYVTGTSPIPAGGNPNWPHVVFEAGFGSGFNTPDSEITWTDLTSRLWHWDETTGIQYQLGEIQATNLMIELDNYDAALSPLNTGSAYYSNAINSNMSFQAGTSPWAAQNGATIAQSAAHTYASAFQAIAAWSLQVTPDGVTAAPGAVSEKDAVSASAAYSASAWFYSAAGYATGAQVAVTWYTSGGAVISTATSSATAVPAAAWTQVTLLNQASPANAASAAVTVQFSGTPPAAAFWVAEAALVPGAAAVSTGLVSPGTPVRLRAAIGTLGGVTANRWYVIQRNAMQWEERITEARRKYCEVTCTDLWAALSSTPPTFYRAEVYANSPYAWWPCDDQPGNANVLPTSLRNAALGNTSALNITVSPNGAASQTVYMKNGTSATGAAAQPPGVAIYAAGADGGWMTGDPQTSLASIASEGGAVTATPGSAAVQFSGQAGTTGSYGWFASCNDANFPGLSGGVTIEAWFSYPFYAGASGYETSTNVWSPFLQQPYNTQLTIWEIATGSNPVAILYLDTSGHLILETFNGAAGTTHSIYTASDLRSSSWHMVTVTLTATTWQVWVDGGATANVSGTATGMTSGWSWLILNGDLGANGGSAAGTGLVHGGNVSLSHIAVYPYQLPYYRVMAHYWAAVTSFGQLPAPTGVQVSWTNVQGQTGPATMFAPDGTQGPSITGYAASSGVAMSAVVTATAPGGITSGQSAWTVGASVYYSNGTGHMFPWVSWTGLAPSFSVYTSASVGNDTQAAVVNGSGDSFASGYGATASGGGVCQSGAGSGAYPPSSASSIGDTAGQRIERLMRAGRAPSPNRCIDPAPLLVIAPGTAGAGQQAGTGIQAIQQSDSGWLYVDNLNNITYWQKSHLAAQYGSPVWQIGPATSASRTPYYERVTWVEDPQQVYNVIQVEPVSPTGATLPLITPTNTAAIEASQARWGSQPLQVTSYLQSSTEQQSQANWLFQQYGQPQRRVENVRIEAAAYPSAFPLVVGICVGDVVQIEDWQIGGGGQVYTYRVNQIERRISGGGRNVVDAGAENADQIAEVIIQAVLEPSSYWS